MPPFWWESIDMSDILNKNLVLVLNSGWQAIGVTSIKKALVAMFSTSDGENMAAQALDLEYSLNKEGFVDFSAPEKTVETKIEDWLSLPIRDFDIPVHTAKRIVRAPIILITKNFSKMPYRSLRATKRNVYNHYGGRCIWTGKILSFNEMTLEHMIPKSHGGNESWQNLAPAQKDINNKRGNTPLKDFHLKPQFKLSEPKKTAVGALIVEAKRPEWEYFMMNKKWN